jgi:ribose transport system permease protein
MNRLAGILTSRIFGILCIVLLLYALVLASDPAARTLGNHQNLMQRVALFGILTLGAGTLILAGGIDLSMGSVFCLAGVTLGLLLNHHFPAGLAVTLVLAGGAFIGLVHGLLITRLRLQPFIVTLCGLFIWRGMAYWLALPDPMAPLRGLARFLTFGYAFADAPVNPGSAGTVGIGSISKEIAALVYLSTGKLHVTPVRLLLMVALFTLFGILLHRSVYGRYLFAVGANEQAARYAGIRADRSKVLAYVLCSMLGALAGMLQLLELKTVQPSNAGQFYELYAITGAVLGGCSLRGGEGTVLGMLLGTAVLPLLRNLINLSGLPDDLEFFVIGLALLAGTILDELLKRRAASRGRI